MLYYSARYWHIIVASISPKFNDYFSIFGLWKVNQLIN